ncbi:hypothetical protein ACHAXR_009154 [Thalassiosira sp. AJA248-18]
MADGKSKSDICSAVVEAAAAAGDQIPADDAEAARCWHLCAPAVNAPTGAADAAKNEQIRLRQSFIVLPMVCMGMTSSEVWLVVDGGRPSAEVEGGGGSRLLNWDPFTCFYIGNQYTKMAGDAHLNRSFHLYEHTLLNYKPTISAMASPVQTILRVPVSNPTAVYQDNFSPARGNALQAVVASIFGLHLRDVPNFIESPLGYEAAITRFYQQGVGEGNCVKIQLNGSCEDENNDIINEHAYKAADVRYLRSPEDELKLSATREDCIENIDSVLNHQRATGGMYQEEFEEFQRAVAEAKQKYLDAIPKGPHNIPEKFNNMICILRGKSPRGDFGHVVVAKHVADGMFTMVHDPHPDGTNLDVREAYGWCLFFA